MNDIKNLIFDLDGTLIDSSEGIVDAVNYALREVGAPERQPKEIHRYIGYSLEIMFPNFTDHPVDEMHKLFRVRADKTVIATSVALGGVDEVLETLHGLKYRMSIATTKAKFHVDAIVDKLGWRRYFEVLVGGNEVSNVKPDPEIFILAMDRMGVTPADSIVIGDTVNDILGAKAVPVRAVAVDSPFGDRQATIDAGPDFSIRTLAELPALLQNGARG